MDNNVLEQMIKDVMSKMSAQQVGSSVSSTAQTTPKSGGVTSKDYPLSEKYRSAIKTPTGKGLDDLTLEGVLNGSVTADDVKISPQTLEMQAQVAESVGRHAFAKNLRRAAELIAVPDERILEIYSALRPYRSTKSELLAIADELDNKYNAKINSALLRESAELYEKRGRLKA